MRAGKKGKLIITGRSDYIRSALMIVRETGIYQSNIVPAISGSMYAISRLRINGIEE